MSGWGKPGPLPRPRGLPALLRRTPSRPECRAPRHTLRWRKVASPVSDRPEGSGWTELLGLEEAEWQRDAALLELVEECRPESGRTQPADDCAVAGHLV